MEYFRMKVQNLFTPTNLNEAMYLTGSLLKAFGIFPYKWIKDRYELSLISLAITFVHILVFSFINVKLMYEDIKEYSSPNIFNNSVGVAGQFVLKMLGVLNTLTILFGVLYGAKPFKGYLDRALYTLYKLEELDLDIKPLYRKLLFFTIIQTLVMIAMATWTLVDGFVFFEKTNHTLPTLEYFFIGIMSTLYKYGGLMNMFTCLCIVYEINEFLNRKFRLELENFVD